MSSLSIQVKVDNPDTTTMALMLRYKKLPTLKTCEHLKVIQYIDKKKGMYFV
jgi:hypothetical protein